MKKRILCFGDSLTWGYNPIDASRYDENTRWTGVLSTLLGDDYAVVEEGLNSRTTVIDDLFQGVMSGLTYLEPCLKSQKPIDLLIIMLGSNDAKNIYNAHAERIAHGCKRLIKVAQDSKCGVNDDKPEILLIAPPIIQLSDTFSSVYDQSAVDRSQEFGHYYELIAKEMSVNFLDTSKYIKTCDVDGVHLDEESNKVLAQVLYNKVKEIIG